MHILIFTMSLRVSNPRVNLREDGCTYRFTCQRYKNSSIYETAFCRWHVNRLYHTCTYNRLPEDEPSGS